nr:immunoglobulin heavy chain junction region [Mus musculus]
CARSPIYYDDEYFDYW